MSERTNDLISKLQTGDELDNIKKWLFKENIRLEELKKDIEEERELIRVQKELLNKQRNKNILLQRQLEIQKNLFDQKWQLLESETKRLALERERFNRERDVYKDKVRREANVGTYAGMSVKIFFKGVCDTASLKRRYKELLKIFHPDNANGDNDIVQAINIEYENLKRFYIGT